MSLTSGSKVWVEDNQLAWVQAEVVEAGSEAVTAIIERERRLVVCLTSKVHPREVDILPGGVDDMIKLAYLHEPGVLYNLANRYDLSDIYTYTGNILIAVNPFKKLPHLYDAHMMEQYRGSGLGELHPHVFAIADTAYRAMINDGQNQSILVSGESGAGKTETTKLIMQYLAYVGGRVSNPKSVEQQVLESNPLLESFGNAKTIRNDNSSRFGKFVEIHFDATGRISGAAIRTYLLERSRVVNITKSERNYHCFYQLCASSEAAIKYKLTDPKDFFYLNQSSCLTLDGHDERKDYFRTRKAMDTVGINSAEQDAIFRTLAAILHLGNVEFISGKEHDSSALKDIASLAHLQTAAELLMCDHNTLKNALCTRAIFTGGESITKMLDPEAALTNRDTLAKAIYSHLFDWLVEKINKSIGQDKRARAQIGVLDIYGFESFEINSFEQFCINFANEKLQQHFNEHVLKTEQEEYGKEAIDWSYIDYIDNQDVLDLIEKRPLGIIALLDESCMFPKSTNETFSANLFHTFKSHGRFRKPKRSSTEFIISHYAGEVIYQADCFLEKNKDYVVVEHEDLLLSSKDPFISSLVPSRLDDENRPCYKFSSVATRFKQQLQELLETLSTTEPHYIRCVKPNSNNKPGQFENLSVIHQLRCGGVLEAVRISCSGYPTRKDYESFLQRFAFLAPEFTQSCYDKRSATQKLLRKLEIDKYQLGITKVFLKVGEMAKLNAKRAEALDKFVRVIQRKFRSYIRRKNFVEMRLAATKIQSHWRGYKIRFSIKRKGQEEAATFIQASVRMWLSQQHFQGCHSSALDRNRKVPVFLSQKAGRNLIHSTKAQKTQNDGEKSKVAKLHAAFSEKEQQLQAIRTLLSEERETNRKLSMQLTSLHEERLLLEASKNRNLELETESKHLRAEMKAKTTELTRLQAALFEMQQQIGAMELLITDVTEANQLLSMQLACLNEERSLHEATEAQKSELANENQHLITMVDTYKHKALQAEKQLLKARKESEERLLKSKEIEVQMEEVHRTLQRLEEKLFFLEIENQVLRNEAWAFPTNGAVHPVKGVHLFRPFNISKVHFQAKDPCDQMLQRLVVQGQKDTHKESFTEELDYTTLQAENTQIFHQLTHPKLEVQGSTETLSYWLSHTATLLSFLQNNNDTTSAPITLQLLQTKMAKFSHGVPTTTLMHLQSVSNHPDFSQNEEGFPGLQQLAMSVQKIYKTLRENLKKEILPVLTTCIQMPSQRSHWHGVTNKLNSTLSILSFNHVPPFLVSGLFTQIFCFINVHLFNSLLLRRECCSFSNGEYVKAGLAELEQWICSSTQKYAGHSWDELELIRQAVEFLVIHQKDKRTFYELKHVLCPGLSLQQLYRITTMYWDDQYGTPSVSPEIIVEIKNLMAEEPNSHLVSSFLLDDDPSLPFSGEDLIASMAKLDVTSIDIQPYLQKHPGL